MGPFIVLLMFFTLLAFTPGTYKKRFISGQCQHCRYSRARLDAAAPCPECGQPYLFPPGVDSDEWDSYGRQCVRGLSILAVCVGFVVAQQWLMHLAYALSYYMEGFLFSTSWKAALVRDIRRHEFTMPYLMVCVIPPLPLLAFLPSMRRTFKALAAVLAIVSAFSFTWGMLTL